MLLVEVLDGEGRPRQGVLVRAQAVDERGRPAGEAAGALEPIGELGVVKGVLPFPEEVMNGGARRGPGLSAVTDKSGGARLLGVPAGRLLVTCSDNGLSAAAEVVVPETVGEGGVRLLLRLQPAPASLLLPEGDEVPADGAVGGAALDLVLAGVVLDERGLNLPGAHIEARAGRIARPGLSDAAGRFALTGLPAGPVTLTVQHAGFAPLRVTAGPEGGPLRLQLQPGGGVEGLVRERRLGGVPERLVLALASAGHRLPLPVGRDGRFRVTGVPAGEATLEARAPGHVPLARRVTVPAAERPDTVTLRDLLLELEVAGAVAGRLRDGSGPAAGVAVRFLDEQGTEVGRTTTSRQGEFRHAALPAGRLVVEASGPAGRAREVVDVTSGREARVELELR
jgi:hypothetical protein